MMLVDWMFFVAQKFLLQKTEGSISEVMLKLWPVAEK
jgi:hypothetical protein